MEEQYYKHSGIVNPIGLFLIPIIGIPCGVILSCIYSYAIFYIPFIYLNFFITLFFGIFLGFILRKIAIIGKVRNTSLLMITGLIVGSIALYCSWITWIYAFTEHAYYTVDPSDMWLVISKTAELGAWTIFGWTPTGWALYLIWGIEALMIVGVTSILASTIPPYCENCKQWLTNEIELPPISAISDIDSIKIDLENGSIHSLLSIGLAEQSSATYATITIVQCDCLETNLLTIKTLTTEIDDGKEKTEETVVINEIIITQSDFEKLKDNWK